MLKTGFQEYIITSDTILIIPGSWNDDAIDIHLKPLSMLLLLSQGGTVSSSGGGGRGSLGSRCCTLGGDTYGGGGRGDTLA